MGIDLHDAKQMFEDIRDHIGHDIACVRYGEGDECINVAIECNTCGSILISQDAPVPPKTIMLPIGDIIINVDKENPGAGAIQSSLHESCPFCGSSSCDFTCDDSRTTDEANTELPEQVKERFAYNSAIDGIEAMILACACAEIDIEAPAFLEAIETSIQAAATNNT